MKKFFLKYIIILSVLLASAPASAAPATVKARLDSVQILMGRIAMMHLEVVQDAKAKGEFEIFHNMPASGYIGVCGDSVEIRTAFKRDTTDIGSGRIQIDYTVPVQAFDSGFYRLPQLKYVLGKDTIHSNPLTLKVLPVTGVTADSEISGYADVMEPADSSIFDAIPDWLYYYWWLIVLALAVVAVTLYLLNRFRTKGSILPKKPQPSPYVVAMRSLEALKSRNLCEQGLEREYYTDLTEILRSYLDRRFGINAMEMTTRQIIEHLSEDNRIKDKREYMRQVLNMADFVKFAAGSTLPDDNVAAYNNAVRFVEETRPTPEEEEAAKNATKPEDGFEIAPEKGEGKPQSKKTPKKSKLKKSAKKGGEK